MKAFLRGKDVFVFTSVWLWQEFSQNAASCCSLPQGGDAHHVSPLASVGGPRLLPTYSKRINQIVQFECEMTIRPITFQNLSFWKALSSPNFVSFFADVNEK